MLNIFQNYNIYSYPLFNEKFDLWLFYPINKIIFQIFIFFLYTLLLFYFNLGSNNVLLMYV